jgi:hypothetical protein
MTVVRVSKGRFDLRNLDQAERLLAASDQALRQPLSQLTGLLHYYVGIDREQGYLTNVSVWETLEDAHQMDTLTAMLAQRPILEAGRRHLRADHQPRDHLGHRHPRSGSGNSQIDQIGHVIAVRCKRSVAT